MLSSYGYSLQPSTIRNQVIEEIAEKLSIRFSIYLSQFHSLIAGTCVWLLNANQNLESVAERRISAFAKLCAKEDHGSHPDRSQAKREWQRSRF